MVSSYLVRCCIELQKSKENTDRWFTPSAWELLEQAIITGVEPVIQRVQDISLNEKFFVDDMECDLFSARCCLYRDPNSSYGMPGSYCVTPDDEIAERWQKNRAKVSIPAGSYKRLTFSEPAVHVWVSPPASSGGDIAKLNESRSHYFAKNSSVCSPGLAKRSTESMRGNETNGSNDILSYFPRSEEKSSRAVTENTNTEKDYLGAEQKRYIEQDQQPLEQSELQKRQRAKEQEKERAEQQENKQGGQKEQNRRQLPSHELQEEQQRKKQEESLFKEQEQKRLKEQQNRKQKQDEKERQLQLKEHKLNEQKSLEQKKKQQDDRERQLKQERLKEQQVKEQQQYDQKQRLNEQKQQPFEQKKKQTDRHEKQQQEEKRPLKEQESEDFDLRLSPTQPHKGNKSKTMFSYPADQDLITQTPPSSDTTSDLLPAPSNKTNKSRNVTTGESFQKYQAVMNELFKPKALASKTDKEQSSSSVKRTDESSEKKEGHDAVLVSKFAKQSTGDTTNKQPTHEKPANVKVSKVLKACGLDSSDDDDDKKEEKIETMKQDTSKDRTEASKKDDNGKDNNDNRMKSQQESTGKGRKTLDGEKEKREVKSGRDSISEFVVSTRRVRKRNPRYDMYDSILNESPQVKKHENTSKKGKPKANNKDVKSTNTPDNEDHGEEYVPETRGSTSGNSSGKLKSAGTASYTPSRITGNETVEEYVPQPCRRRSSGTAITKKSAAETAAYSQTPKITYFFQKSSQSQAAAECSQSQSHPVEEYVPQKVSTSSGTSGFDAGLKLSDMSAVQRSPFKTPLTNTVLRSPRKLPESSRTTRSAQFIGSYTEESCSLLAAPSKSSSDEYIPSSSTATVSSESEEYIPMRKIRCTKKAPTEQVSVEEYKPEPVKSQETTTQRPRTRRRCPSSEEQDASDNNKRLSSIPLATIRKLFRSQVDTFHRMSKGAVESRRHHDFKKGGKTKSALFRQVFLQRFSPKQMEVVTDLFLQEFVVKRRQTADYVEAVLVPEFLIRLCMQQLGMSFEESDRYLEENDLDSSQEH